MKKQRKRVKINASTKLGQRLIEQQQQQQQQHSFGYLMPGRGGGKQLCISTTTNQFRLFLPLFFNPLSHLCWLLLLLTLHCTNRHLTATYTLVEHAGHGVLILAPRTVGVAIADVLVVDAQKAAVRVGSGTGEAVDAVLRRGTVWKRGWEKGTRKRKKKEKEKESVNPKVNAEVGYSCCCCWSVMDSSGK